MRQIEIAAKGKVENRPVGDINLSMLERSLQNNPWIRDAEMYFDNRQVLNVVIHEREPIARVFTTAGVSFYVDNAGKRMPLMNNAGARVPVVTGFTNAKKLNAKDSALIKEVKEVVQYIYAHPFWNAQIGQIDITSDNKFELISLVGDHVIKIGNADNIEEKLNKLYVFYQQVLSQAGFNKYRVLDVQYQGQIVATKKGTVSKVDSLRLKKNIEELLNKKMEERKHVVDHQKIKDSIDTSLEKNNFVSVKTNSNPVPLKKTNPGIAKTNPSIPVEKQKEKQEAVKPKAVMSKKN